MPRSPSIPSSPRERQRLERAVTLYLDDCYRRLSVARVSELAIYLLRTRPHISRAIRAITGQSASQYLRARQFQRAKSLLSESDLRVAQIAAMSAFGTARSFYRCFRRTFGMSPTAYRKGSPIVARRTRRRALSSPHHRNDI